MLQKLPSELLSCISSYLSADSAGALAQTCNHCYWSMLPVVYQEISVTKPNELFALSSKLSKNKLYSERARQYMRSVSIVDHSQRTLARYAVTSIMGHVLSGWELLEEEEERQQQIQNEEENDQVSYSDDNGDNDHHGSIKRKQHIQSMAVTLEKIFPRLTELVMEFDQITEGIQLFNRNDNDNNNVSDNYILSPSIATDFSGHVKLTNYRPCHPYHLYSLLASFTKCTELVLHTRPYLSLCAAIQDSLLMDQDVEALIRLNMKSLIRLELAYVDDFLDIQKLCELVQSLPNLEHLSLEWILPPSLEYYSELCECLIDLSLYPGPMIQQRSTYTVRYKYHTHPPYQRQKQHDNASIN